MAERIYRLTQAGRKAWEQEDSAVPADYRRILWVMDVHGGGAENLARLYPAEMLMEWLSELEEIGLIEAIPQNKTLQGPYPAEDRLAKMRRHQALGSLPIVLTARSDPADIGRGLVRGADGYITKPYTKNLLADVIRKVLKHT